MPLSLDSYDKQLTRREHGVFILAPVFGCNPKGFMLKAFSKEDEGNRVAEEKIRVDAYSGYRGEETPREFIFHGKKVEVVEVLSAWIEEGL